MIMKKFAILSILALLLPLFTSVSVFADSEDVVYTLNSSTTDVVVCNNNNESIPNCSDYKYLKIVPSATYAVNQFFTLALNFGSANRQIPATTYNFDLSGFSNLTQVYFAATSSGMLDEPNIITLILTNTSSAPSGTLEITSNGTYDVTNYASVDVEVPQTYDCDDNFIVSSFKIIFINLVTGIIPTCALIFVVWFFIDMITSFVYGRGR